MITSVNLNIIDVNLELTDIAFLKIGRAYRMPRN